MRILLLALLLCLLSLGGQAQDFLSDPSPVNAWSLDDYLEDVLEIDFDGTSPYLVVELSKGQMALFRSEEEEPWGSQAEVAGYRMSRWLGLEELVPETVVRRLAATDLPAGSWPYQQKSRMGSLQAWLPARPITDQELAGVPVERKAAIELLSFLMGRYDNHLGNTLIDDTQTVFIVDFENALEYQKVRYGEYPFVRKGQGNHDLPSVPAGQPFPFDDALVLQRPTLEQLEAHLEPFRAPWSGSTEALHQMVSNSLDQTLRSVVWDHHQWLQIKVRSRHPSCTDVYPAALMFRLAQLNLEVLEKEVLLPPFTRRHAQDILERRDQILLAAAKANQAR